MATLKVRNLSKAFPALANGSPVSALADINFQVSGQKFVSVVGPSGCGKSTLLNIVSGVEKPSDGTVEIESDRGTEARLGYVFQDPRLLPWRSVIENMLYVHDDQSETMRKRMVEYLEMVGLEKHADYFPSQLSGGMQQRVGIARAFGVEPDLLLMDEPFSHLDAITARGLRVQLQEIWSATRKTVLFVTHDVMEAVELSDRIIVMARGGTLQEDLPIELERPRRISDPKFATLQAEILGRLEEQYPEDASS